MPDRNDLGESFAEWQSELDEHLEAAKRKRLCVWVPFITGICLSIGAILAHWRHTVLVERYCAPPTNVCAAISDSSTKEFWIGWLVATTLSLTVISVGAAVAMLVARFVPRYSHRLYISGPFQDPERRHHFTGYFWTLMGLASGLLALTIFESLS